MNTHLLPTDASVTVGQHKNAHGNARKWYFLKEKKIMMLIHACEVWIFMNISTQYVCLEFQIWKLFHQQMFLLVQYAKLTVNATLCDISKLSFSILIGYSKFQSIFSFQFKVSCIQSQLYIKRKWVVYNYFNARLLWWTSE